MMAKGNSYSGKPPPAMLPQQRGTPRNTGSPPPDLPPGGYSEPPRTQAVRPGNGEQGGDHTWTPQPNQRPGERGNTMAGKQGPGPDPKPMNGPAKPTGTMVPERRGMKDGRGDGGVPGQVGASPDVPMDAFNIAHPSPTEGYKPPGKPERGGP